MTDKAGTQTTTKPVKALEKERAKPREHLEELTEPPPASGENNSFSVHSTPISVHHVAGPSPKICSPSVRSSSNKRTIDILNAVDEVPVERKRQEVKVSENDENEAKTGQDVKMAASFYDNLKRDSQADRGKSLLFHMRALNNWIKSVLIGKFVPPKAKVLDLACGKGGDIAKWYRHRIDHYVGVDVARQSLNDAVSRIQSNRRWDLDKIKLAQADLGSIDFFTDHVDCWDDARGWHTGTILKDREDRFDIVSMQFSLHYLFGERERTQLLFQTIRDLLRPEGYFIATTVDPNVMLQHHFQNVGRESAEDDLSTLPIQFFDEKGREACRITMDKNTVERIRESSSDDPPYGLRYEFLLRDSDERGEEAVNAPEYLIPNPLLKQLLIENDLELILQSNFHRFVKDSMRDSHARGLMDRMHVLDFTGSISQVEWKIARLYQVLAFRRRY